MTFRKGDWGKDVKCFWVVILSVFLGLNLYVAVSRKKVSPISTYSMFYRPLSIKKSYRAGYLRNNQIQILPVRFNSKWNRTKYKRFLKQKKYDMVDSLLFADCRYVFKERCKAMSLVVIRRKAIDDGSRGFSFRNKVVYKVADKLGADRAD